MALFRVIPCGSVAKKWLNRYENSKPNIHSHFWILCFVPNKSGWVSGLWIGPLASPYDTGADDCWRPFVVLVYHLIFKAIDLCSRTFASIALQVIALHRPFLPPRRN